MAAVLRGKTVAERLRMPFDANRTARLLIEGSLRTRHPDWTGFQIRQEIARRMLGTSRGRPCGSGSGFADAAN